jgi:hypothetical protein
VELSPLRKKKKRKKNIAVKKRSLELTYNFEEDFLTLLELYCDATDELTEKGITQQQALFILNSSRYYYKKGKTARKKVLNTENNKKVTEIKFCDDPEEFVITFQ